MKNPTLTDLSDSELKSYYLNNSDYSNNFENKQFLTNKFLNKYHNSLFFYKHFYDDLTEVGNEATAKEIFYFIPGFNGTPGQIRFGLPSLLRKFGKQVYVKSLFLEEFSCKIPCWEKYSLKNLELRRKQIEKDLKELSSRHKHINIITSSSGFYDFLGSWPQLQDIKKQLSLYWISCAPDAVSTSPWEKVFYKLNGFKKNNHKWFSYPNLQSLKTMNPECGTHKKWKNSEQKNTFFKNCLESRFYVFGFLWDYISSDYLNQLLEDNIKAFKAFGEPVDIETTALAATKDGFWDNSSPENINSTVCRYIVNPKILYKQTSHLWVVTPDHLSDMFN